MNIADKRREEQLVLLNDGGELQWGDVAALPVSLKYLKEIGDGHPAVLSSHTGLTAFVYCVEIDGTLWNLKKKRDEILVKNTDGQVSFINEVQRRIRLEEMRAEDPQAYAGIVQTVFASLSEGIILSRWITGEHIREFNRSVFASLFETLFAMDRAGIMEYDLCSGNLLLTPEGRIMLFDFGYAYPYDPGKYYNPDGLDIPLFHPVERLESRSLMQYLMDMEERSGRKAVLSLYREEKEEALRYYRKRREWLGGRRAEPVVLEWMDRFIGMWSDGVASPEMLEEIYALESFRSYVLDLDDDLRGQSCTPGTLKKADRILELLETHYDFLREKGGFFWGDEKLSRTALLEKYRSHREKAVGYQL